MIRLSRVNWGLYGIIIIIQPMCAIDEYAMIFRVWVWFKPPHAPIKIESTATRVVRLAFNRLWTW